jgi:hypothetical protein
MGYSLKKYICKLESIKRIYSFLIYVKNMKKTVLSTSLLMCAFLLFNFTLPPKVDVDNNKIEVYFDNTINFNDLVKIKQDLVQHQIVLDFQLLEFDKAGKLIAIGYTVTIDGKNWGGGKTADLTSKYGFIVDRNPDARYLFQVGVRKKE